MKNWPKLLKVLFDIQILSALIWAAVIILASWIAKDNNLSILLITVAGFHVILLSHFSKKKLRTSK